MATHKLLLLPGDIASAPQIAGDRESAIFI
jgi:hypothetical protein